LVTTDAILVFGIGSIFGVAAMVSLKDNVEKKVKERLKVLPKSERENAQVKKAAERPNNWLLASILLYVFSGLLVLGFYFVNDNPTVITPAAPVPTANVFLYYLGSILFIVGTIPFVLVIIFIFRPHTKLVDYLTARAMLKWLGYAGQAFIRAGVIGAVVTLEYVWLRYLVYLGGLIVSHGIEVFNLNGYALFFALFASFGGAAILIYHALPITPDASWRRLFLGLALMSLPIVVLAVISR
jgi:hypothetical protein